MTFLLFLPLINFSVLWVDVFTVNFRCFLPIEAKKLLLGRHFLMFLGILMDFLLTIRIDFFCMGRRRRKMIEICLPITPERNSMGRNKIKIGIYGHENSPKHAKRLKIDYKISTPRIVG